MTTDAPEEPEEPAPALSPPATEAPPPPPRRAPRRLTRSRRDHVVAGVAGGLANYLDVDANWVRVAFIIATVVSGGAFIVLYIAGVVLMPRDDGEAVASTWTARGPSSSSPIGAIVLGLVLIGAGAIALLQTLDVQAPPWSAVFAAALAVVGLGIIVDGRRGVNGGLVAIALLLTVLLAAGGSGPSLDFDSAFGEQTWRPASAAQLDREYSHGFGQLNLDLRAVDLPPGETNLRISIAFGEVNVTLPPNIPVRVTGRTSFGQSEILGQDFDGTSVAHDYRTPDYDAATRRLNIDLDTSFGSAQVHR